MSILKDNSYHILGLDTSASQKDVSKRSKEIVTRLKIDDVPSYNLDLDIFEGFRTEASVKKAVDKLTSPKNQIKEYFFWFQVADDVDEQAVGLFRNGDYDEAVRVWEHHSAKGTVKALLYKKNLAILYSLLLYKNSKSQYLSKSVKVWKELIDSEKFWNAFSKVYKLHDELGADESVIEDFKKHIADSVSDIFTDLSSRHNDQDFVSSFSNVFGLKGKKMETDVVDPIYKKINDAVEELDKLNVSADGIVDSQEASTIKSAIRVIQEELNKLLDLGLYDDSHTKLLRDRAGAVLRKISIDLNNNLNETGMALGLIKIADKISGTDSLKSRIQQDLKMTQQNHDIKNRDEKHKKIIDPIVADVTSGNSDRALQTINNYLYNPETSEDLKKALQEIKTFIEERTVKYGKPVGSPPSLFVIWGFGLMLYGDTVYITGFFVPIIAVARYTVEPAPEGGHYFRGKLQLKQWQVIYNVVVPILLIILFLANN
ncbi:MAG: hypothetical protein WC880_03905 [Candidatus Paceibacterota bacterium]